ncbi:hypothetical protein Tco_0674163 [Tanacetum coccineum]
MLGWEPEITTTLCGHDGAAQRANKENGSAGNGSAGVNGSTGVNGSAGENRSVGANGSAGENRSVGLEMSTST